MIDINPICEAVHKAYCAERVKQGKTPSPYWTGGDYSGLNETIKDYDRAAVRAVLSYLVDNNIQALRGVSVSHFEQLQAENERLKAEMREVSKPMMVLLSWST